VTVRILIASARRRGQVKTRIISNSYPELTISNSTVTVSQPEELGIDRVKLKDLKSRVRKEVDEGLLPSVQVALARKGEIVMFETIGAGTNDSLYCTFSATKAITSSAVWLLIQDYALDVTQPVAGIIPEFASNGKERVTVEQLLLHTSGFPNAPFRVSDWSERERRIQRFASWRLDYPAGSHLQYHPMASMWVIAEIIERVSGMDFGSFIRSKIALPLQLPDLWLGIPTEHHSRIQTVRHCGNEPSATEYRAAGVEDGMFSQITPDSIEDFNLETHRLTPIPGGGCITSAASLALFYQALIGQTKTGESPWHSSTVDLATLPRTAMLVDPMIGVPANRALGVVVSGDQLRNRRGFGHTNSPLAFGHEGVGGQIGWVDPATGISFAYLTNGHDRNRIRQGRRGISISNKAAVCNE
jgi:CubicO group peptidase (beta-lactamase class C family)